MRVASIDIGTNTALLLIADVGDAKETLHEVRQERRTIRLGEGLGESRRVSPIALDRLQNALNEYGQIIEEYSVQRLIVTGTSASRDAANKDELSRIVLETLHAPYSIISGDTEAYLTFQASASQDFVKSAVIDIGGGSTELVRGRRLKSGIVIDHAISFDIGSVRLTERFLSVSPILESDFERMNDYLSEVLADVVPLDANVQLIGVGGAVTTAALVIRGLKTEDVDSDPVLTISIDEVDRFYSMMASSPVEDIHALDPVLMHGRADVIAAGVYILKRLMDKLGANVLDVSFKGLRHGAAAFAAQPDFKGTIENI